MLKYLYLSIFFLLFLNNSYSQDDLDLVKETFTERGFKSKVEFLASDALAGRNALSAEADIAAEYIKYIFQTNGIAYVPGTDTYFQDVFIREIAPPSNARLRINNLSSSFASEFIVMDAEDGHYKGSAVFINYGNLDDLDQLDIEGKIVVAMCGDGNTQDFRSWYVQATSKREEIMKRGGIALIELYANRQRPFRLISNYLGRRKQTILINENQAIVKIFAHIWIDGSNQEYAELLKKKDTEIEIIIEGMKPAEIRKTKNVMAYVEGNDPNLKDEVVVYCAHYDHVGIGRPDAEGDTIYNGARDNAIGTASVLSLAEHVSKYPLRRSSLFVLFTAEEKGLLGSKWFVENSPVPLHKIVFALNSDNGGYNDTSRATIIGLNKTTANKIFVDACDKFGLEAKENEAENLNLFNRSDNASFAIVGIPAPSFGMGFQQFDQEMRKYYHRPSDQSDNLDFNYLNKFALSFILSGRKIGNTLSRLFWSEGDEYYQSGIKLYNK